MPIALRQTLKIALFVLVSVTIIIYSYVQTKNLIIGPKIAITSPQNGSTVTDPLITLLGTSKNISKISVNDRPILVDQRGNFRDELVVQIGYNIISIKGSDRFGKEKEVTLEIVRQEIININ